ncbi:MAG: HAD hydrolase family protein [Gammaproteobacteria bacterium]|nr:HAD hydrolase family protein [Gammaproteobacteria bacterium]
MEIQNRAALVRLLICDVDGTLTDGRLLLGPGGVEFKQFHVHDGYGLRQVMDAGIEVAIVSGRDSIVVTERMQALGVRYIHQGVGDKLAVVSELIRQLGLSLAQVCFVGDDEPDAPVMRRVGLGVAVANAHPSALAAAHCRTDLRGGHGAVREVCELLMRAQRPPRGAGH